MAPAEEGDLPTDSLAIATHEDPVGYVQEGGALVDTLPYICKIQGFAYPVQNVTQKQINFGGAVTCSAVVNSISVTVRLFKLNTTTLGWELQGFCSNSFASVGFVNCSGTWPATGSAPLIASYRVNATSSVRFPSLYSPPTVSPAETSYWAF